MTSNDDRNKPKSLNTSDTLHLIKFITQFNITDAYRHKHPTTRCYTFIQQQSASRIDRIYISDTLTSHIIDCNHIPTTFSDHYQTPFIKIKIAQSLSHPSTYWKLNNSILLNTSDNKCIKSFITQLNQNAGVKHDPVKWWESFKDKTKGYLIYISKLQSQNRENQQSILEKILTNAMSRNNLEEIIKNKQRT